MADREAKKMQNSETFILVDGQAYKFIINVEG